MYFYESILQYKSIHVVSHFQTQQLKSYPWFIFPMFDRNLIQNDMFYEYGGTTNNNVASVHVLGNPKVVDRQQRARSAGTHVSNILSEDGRQERAVPAVDLPAQQLRRHVCLNLSTSSLSLSLSLGLSMSLALSLIHSCSCIQKLNIQLKIR
jgi:hypothetical protein